MVFDQRSEEWYVAKLGHAGCSRIADILASGQKGQPSATRKNYMGELLCERLTGRHIEKFSTPETQWGKETEPLARSEYEYRTGSIVIEHCGMEHPEISWWWGSPDGLVGDDGGVEIKCLNTMNHLDVLMSGKISTRYLYQIAGYVEIFNREWWDYVGYDPRLPSNVCYFRKRFMRYELPIKEVKEGVIAFLSELDELEKRVRAIA